MSQGKIEYRFHAFLYFKMMVASQVCEYQYQVFSSFVSKELI